MTEKWLPVPGFEGKYEVSNLGRIRTIPRLLKESTTRDGYRQVGLHDRRGTGKDSGTQRVHWVVAKVFLGPRPRGHQINHKDGNKTNNAASNLEYVTQSYNIKHAFRAGLMSQKGEKNGCAKLREADVIRVRRLRANGMRIAEIARRTGVPAGNVENIIYRRTWTHLK